jgi:short-subunit dehydrogenase
MNYYRDKVIWITGASSGIGKAVAVYLSQFNCKLILSARREKELNETKMACSESNHIAVLPFDLAYIDTLDEVVDRALGVFGTIDILVNNAGISQRSALLETSIEVDRKLMDIDYLATIALSKALLPHFIKHQKGQFVVVSSLMGVFSSPYRSAYCGAKHALHGFFNALRLEHAKDRISVTLICPGFVNTNIARNALTGDGSRQGYQDKKTEAGVPVDIFARKMSRAIARKKFEAYIGGFERIGVFIGRLSPRLIHFIVQRMQVR